MLGLWWYSPWPLLSFNQTHLFHHESASGNIAPLVALPLSVQRRSLTITARASLAFCWVEIWIWDTEIAPRADASCCTTVGGNAGTRVLGSRESREDGCDDKRYSNHGRSRLNREERFKVEVGLSRNRGPKGSRHLYMAKGNPTNGSNSIRAPSPHLLVRRRRSTALPWRLGMSAKTAQAGRRPSTNQRLAQTNKLHQYWNKHTGSTLDCLQACRVRQPSSGCRRLRRPAAIAKLSSDTLINSDWTAVHHDGAI